MGREVDRTTIEQREEWEKRKVLEEWTARWVKDQKRTERVIQPGTEPQGGRDSP
jgi:hypothetical protein